MRIQQCGNWPVLIWPFVAAALRTGRIELAEHAIPLLNNRIIDDNRPEYYDGKYGDLIGRRANFYQTWSATGLIIAHEIMENANSRALDTKFTFGEA